MSYNTDIFKNYFTESDDPRYLEVHKANQESYEDNFADLLPPDRNARILEVGCGAGQFLYYLKGKGYSNIEGVDIGELQVDLLKKMGIDGKVISSIPEYLKDKKDHYDMVIMNHVIEHFSKIELWENLKAIRDSLKTGGVLIFSTPNMACLSGLFQRNVDFTHEIGFTERSAYQVMRVTGFKNITIRPDKVSIKMRPRRIAWWTLNRLWYWILGFVYYIERGSDRPKVISRSLIVAGRK